MKFTPNKILMLSLVALLTGCGGGKCAVTATTTPQIAPFIVTYFNTTGLPGIRASSYVFDGSTYQHITALEEMATNFVRLNDNPIYLSQPAFFLGITPTVFNLGYSNDGITWNTDVTNPCDTNSQVALYNLVNSKSTFVYLRCEDLSTNNTMSLWTTSDGKNFINVNSAPQTDAGSFFINVNDKFTEVDQTGQSAKSLNANGTWSPVNNWTSPNGTNIDNGNIQSNNKNIVVTQNNSDIYVSQDGGTTWTKSATLTTTTGSLNLLYDNVNKLFIAANTDSPSQIITSPDGITWSNPKIATINGTPSSMSLIGALTYVKNYGYVNLNPNNTPSLVMSPLNDIAKFSTFSTQPPADPYTPAAVLGGLIGFVVPSY